MKKVINCTGEFKAGPQHVYLDMLTSGQPQVRVEEDHCLYFDSESAALFVVHSKEYESGPRISYYHSIYPMADYAAEFPKLFQKAVEVVRAKVGNKPGP